MWRTFSGKNMAARSAWPCAIALVLSTTVAAEDELAIHFINVGQGDCTLIECPGSDEIVMVDCGSLGGGPGASSVQAYIEEALGEEAEAEIHTLVITHPDADHYNLLEDVLDGFSVGKILITKGPLGEYSDSFETWLKRKKRRLGSDFVQLSSRQFDPQDEDPQFITCGDATIKVLAANTRGTLSPKNARSIVLLVTYGDFDAVLTGDATFATEKVILERYDRSWLDCEVLKIGHHGSSRTSTSEEWVAAIVPEVAVVSASFRNRHGHPRKSVIARVEEFTHEYTTGHDMRWATNRTTFETRHDYKEAVFSTATSGNVVVRAEREAGDGGTSYWVDFSEVNRRQLRGDD